MAVLLEARPPQDAIAALQARARSPVPTSHYLDLFEAEHAVAGTVARSAGFDVLTDIFNGLETALKEGRTAADFAKELRPLLQAKGWWGRRDIADPVTGEISNVELGSPRRLQTIFDTNMRVSYAAGHWAQFERNKATRPWLRYVAIMDGRTRPEHAARHNLCLRVDDPYWDKWAPPCGYGCRCTLQSLSDRDVQRLRSQLRFKPPADRMVSWTNGRTGEVQKIPAGIDPGWAYNPGKAGHQAAKLAAEKLAAAPPRLAAAAVSHPAWPAAEVADEFAAWFDDAWRLKDTGDKSVRVIGALDDAVLDGLAAQGIHPESGAITVQHEAIRHMARESKAQRGAMVPAELLRRMPDLMRTPRAVLYDTRQPALLYVFEVPGDPRLAKLVVRVDYRIQTRVPGEARQRITTNTVRTAGMVSVDNLTEAGRYLVVSGVL